MRLHEPSFFMLTALAERPLHGYGVMKAVQELSGGRIRLRAGTLYAVGSLARASLGCRFSP